MGRVIYEAYRRGARFDGWRERFSFAAWSEAFRAEGLNWGFYTNRERGPEEVFPWDHIDAAVKKTFLLEDYQWSKRGETREDCRDACYACGILPKFIPLRKQTEAADWECPEVKPRHLRRGQVMRLESMTPDGLLEQK